MKIWIHKMCRGRLAALSLLSILIATMSGCATIRHTPAVYETKSYLNAVEFFAVVDRAVQRADTFDAATFPVPGYPHLRADRFLVGIKDRLQTQEEWDLWLDRLAELGLRSRRNEIINLPPQELSRLLADVQAGDRSALLERLDQQTSELLAARKLDVRDAHLMAAVQDPGEYSMLYRSLGLYPLWSVPISIGAKGAYDGFREWYKRTWDDFPVVGELRKTFHGHNRMSAGGVRGLFDLVPRDAFGLPVFTPEQRLEIVRTFAPMIYQDVDDEFDEFGAIEWTDGQVTVNTQKPVVYYYLSNAFIDGEVVWQINYMHWYTARDGPNAPWLERGRLDGITTRITLNAKGEPVMADIMNTCGCYHFFAPNDKKITQIKTIKKGTDPLVLGRIPAEYPGRPFALRIKTGWHQVLSLFPGDPADMNTTYELRDYATLERLSNGDGGFASVFDTQGVMKGSKRIEYLFFFPSGIKKIGSMRQRGNHPTKMIGRQYFADPHIFTKRFEFRP